MRRGIVALPATGQASVAAPASGIRIGVGESGRPVSLRLFRLAGTRVVLAGRLLPAQLVVVRAAAAGTPVQVVTQRPHLWRPLLPGGSGHVIGASEVRHGGGGPSLVIDDRPVEAPGAATEVRAWQCRIDVRSQWGAQALNGFAHADLTFFGALAGQLVAPVARAFGVPRDRVEALTRLDDAATAVVWRGTVLSVALDPTAEETRLLEAARPGDHVPAALGGAHRR